MENRKKYIYISKEDGGIDGNYASYKTMIEKYVSDMVMANDIISITQADGHDWELYSGIDYIEEDDYSLDIYQYFIIDESDAERLAENTNEIIYYCKDLELYVLGVTHFGSSWSIVPTDLEIITDFSKYLELIEEDDKNE